MTNVMFPHGEMVTVERPQGQTRYGDPLPPLPPITIGPVAFAPRYSTEVSGNRSTVIIGLSMFGEYGIDVQANDVIRRSDGSAWQVEGEPGHWLNPFTGWKAGTEVALRRVTG